MLSHRPVSPCTGNLKLESDEKRFYTVVDMHLHLINCLIRVEYYVRPSFDMQSAVLPAALSVPGLCALKVVAQYHSVSQATREQACYCLYRTIKFITSG